MRAHYGGDTDGDPPPAATSAPSHPSAMDPTLRPAYAACRRMQRRHDPTYFAATSLLPAAVRPAIHAVYGFVRTADQIVDGPDRPATPQRAPRRAGRLGARARARPQRRGAHPVPTALVDAGRRHGLPLDELRTYMTSMRSTARRCASATTPSSTAT